MARFSIIVPVYNSAVYLNECLDSVCGQTFGDFEVICVNDGSVDNSRDLLTAWSMKDERIHVIDKVNGGPSSARNDGIRLAQGDYICFLDADDKLEPYALERLASVIDEGTPDKNALDAVVFGWSYMPAGKADRYVREHVRVRDAFYPAFVPELLFKEMSNPYLRLAVRREALRASGVLFDESLFVGEDAQFLFALYPRIGAVKLISDKLYRYLLPHKGSIMAEYKYDVANLCISDLNAAISIFADWKSAGFLDAYGAQLMKWFVRGQLYTILRQSADIREPLTALVRQMWQANFTNDELLSLDLDEPTAQLVRIVLDSDDEGRLAIDERVLARELLKWRIAEYGIADLAVTAAERTVTYLLENREMLLKGASADGAGSVQKLTATDGSQVQGEADDEPNTADDDQAPVGETCIEPIAFPHPIENPIVSVVVPIYNVAKYLDQALNSIQRQELQDIEIICVNDGSTDESPTILRTHAEHDVRIRVIDKPNGGYGSACNRGLEEARGTWIAIVEPDDWIDSHMYQAMTDFAATFGESVDIVKTPYWRIWMPDTENERRVNCSYRGRIKPASQPFKLADPGVTHLIIHHPSIWSAIYRRSFLESKGIKFMEIPGAGWADNPFLVETLCQAESIVYLDEPFYHYREETPEKTAAVALKGWRVSLERWHDMFDVYERLGVTDENIRRAHIRRGFTYIGAILEHHDLNVEPDVREQVKAVFDRMDDALVFSESNISPGSKQLYARVKGVKMPQVSALPYVAQIVKGGLYNVTNTGPAMTLDTLKGFVGSHAKREGK